jgi:hypothetical protein
MDCIDYPTHEGLRVLFETGIPDGTLPMRTFAVLARTCKWYYGRARPWLLAGRRTIRTLGRSFSRRTPPGSSYMSKIVPITDLRVHSNRMRSITIFDESFPVARIRRLSSIFALVNMWLQAPARIIGDIDLYTTRIITIRINSADYVKIGPNNYAVNLHLNRYAGFPMQDFLGAFHGRVMQLTVDAGPSSAVPVVWSNFTNIVLHYRALCHG